MTNDLGKYHRRSIRLSDYDYAQPGAYFVTICTHKHVCLFGKIVGGEVRLNVYGEIVQEEWLRAANLRPNVRLDEYIVMPNHLHGIIVITGDVGARCTVPLQPTSPQKESFGRPTSNSIPTIVRFFKSAATRRINGLRQTPGVPIWQRNYYEHVVRNDDALARVREYIVHNPAGWADDPDHPANWRSQ